MASRKHRPFVGILFECCNAYVRAYINKDRTAFEARCPKCYKIAEIKIAKDGSTSRFFAAR